MIKQGLVAEVRDLMTMGYNLSLPSMSGIGYRQISMFLQGELDLPAAVQQVKYETHHFARRQYAWFRLRDERIHWFHKDGDILEGVNNVVEAFLKAPKDKQVSHEFL